MDIVPLGPDFGAELRGVTLSDVAADDAAYAAVRAAFEEHSVLVFRAQDVSDDVQIAFSRRFGPLEITKVGSRGVGTNLVILTTIDENGKVVPPDHRFALRNKANQLWHTDSTFKEVPAPREPTLVISSGPKRRENAICTSSLTSWPRNTRTECSSKAARTAA